MGHLGLMQATQSTFKMIKLEKLCDECADRTLECEQSWNRELCLKYQKKIKEIRKDYYAVGSTGFSGSCGVSSAID